MGYIKEFGENIYVPEFLLEQPWEDCSWHNDSAPRFHNETLRVAVWVDYDKPEDREFPESYKYTAVELIFFACDPPQPADPVLFYTDSADKLERWLALYDIHRHLEGAETGLQNLSKHDYALSDELATVIQTTKDRMEELRNSPDLDRFIASRRKISDLSVVGSYDGHGPGYVYLDQLVIEEVNQPKAKYYLRIANMEWLDNDLSRLEEILCDWAVKEDLMD